MTYFKMMFFAPKSTDATTRSDKLLYETTLDFDKTQLTENQKKLFLGIMIELLEPAEDSESTDIAHLIAITGEVLSMICQALNYQSADSTLCFFREAWLDCFKFPEALFATEWEGDFYVSDLMGH